MPSSVLRPSAERHDWLSPQLRASLKTPHPGSASPQQAMMHCESWDCRRQESSGGSAAPTAQVGRFGSFRRWCGLALSQPLTASARTLKLSAHEQCSRSAKAPCSRALPGVEQAGVPRAQQCPVLRTETSGFTLKPSRDDVASKACSGGSSVARLAGHELTSAQQRRHQQRLLCRCAPGLANSAPVALCLSNSRTQMPWQASADATYSWSTPCIRLPRASSIAA